MTTAEFKSILASFNTADFGEYTADTFTSANKYRKPTVYPSADHPRILFTKNTIDALRKNIHAEESAEAYKMYIEYSEDPFDGDFGEVNEKYKHNFSDRKVGIIEAKAFRYAMTGDEKYGYEAIIAAKRAMLTINVPHTVGDWCRTYGHLMYVVACVYDWCYGIMTEEDKKQIVAGGVNLLGMHLETCCYVGEGNKVPIEQGTCYGHGAEDQILVDYLSFAIATFGDASEIYELVGGRVLNDFAEAQNFLLEAGSHWEGSMYGPVRTVATIVSNFLINKMTDGRYTPFSPKLEEAMVTFAYYVRPDGHVYRIGDINENNTAYQFFWFSNDCFYGGTFYKNPYLKSLGYKYLKEFTKFTCCCAGLSVVQFLALNDPEIPHTYDGDIPLTRTTKAPHTNIFAKSAADDKNAFGIYMTMPENYVSSHAHMECGSFQIYYKGPLASDSGAYSGWGGDHHMGYNMQTVSANSILIYNPALKDAVNPRRPKMYYSGGQSIDNGANLPTTLDKIKKHPALGQCTSLGVANMEKNGKYLYSYMAGDMTRAYDEVTADEVTRYMLAVATGDEKCPLAFMTFDRISAKDKSFRKAALIHIQEAPEIKDGYAVVTTTRRGTSGKMIVQTPLGNTDFELVGGEGREFFIPGVDENGKYSLEAGRNLPHGKTIPEGSLEEYGWGRIEITPKTESKTDCILTVLYVTDRENTDAPIKAEAVPSESLAGAEILGKAVLFPKYEKLLENEASFTLSKAGECFVTGVKSGKWTLEADGKELKTVEAAEGENLLVFEAAAGKYTIKPAN